MKKPRTKYYNLFLTARMCIEFVGSANYPHREQAAKETLERAYNTGKYVDVDQVDRELQEKDY